MCECPLEQPTGTQDNEGWVKHDGKSQPVADNVKVEVKFCDDTTDNDRALVCGWVWNSGGYSGDIIAYRIIDAEYCNSCHNTTCGNKAKQALLRAEQIVDK